MAKYLIPSDKTLKAIKPNDERKRINDGEGLYRIATRYDRKSAHFMAFLCLAASLAWLPA